MNENVVKQANEHFRRGEFREAYALYKQASKTLGDALFAFNLSVCEKKLTNYECHNQSVKPPVAVEMDSITQILLSNEGGMQLTDSNRKNKLDYYRQLKSKKSEEVEVKSVNPIPADWPKDLVLSPLPDSTNDFNWGMKRDFGVVSGSSNHVGLSIIIPTFNRSNILDITLACLVNQKTKYKYEVIVADDGSAEELTSVSRKYEDRIDLKFVRQRDYGYQLCAVRNLGLRTAKYDYVAILDCDMAPNPMWVESYMNLLVQSDKVALIGPRKYVDTQLLSAESFIDNTNLLESLPQVMTNNTVAGKVNGTVSVDWRIDHFQKTENLRLCDTPFRFFSGGNVAFAKRWLNIAGWFDEEFSHWGGEDNEFGYRLYRAGCFFRAVEGGMAFHQEPPGGENETDRAAGKAVTMQIVQNKVPYHYRKLDSIEKATIKRVPLVSIYIPAYNCEKTIERCVTSALNQTVTDLEVCICDDGSTDGTLAILKNLYEGHPRVRFVTQINGGIGRASNSAVKLCRGYYIGQLDSDDYLEPDAVELCLKEFFADKKLACVYTTNRNVNPDGSLIANGYNWPLYSREKLTTAMICHHFRMFTARAWSLTAGFDEGITNAVDYDMYLKLSEVGPFKHINRICYNRVLHGENTSIKNLKQQKENHFKVVNMSLVRQNKMTYKYDDVDEDIASRAYQFFKV